MNPAAILKNGVSARTLADRVVEYFNPDRGLQRLRSRTMLAAATSTGQGGYEGGRRERRGTKRWRPPEGSANADLMPDLPDLRARSRDLARNQPIATGAIATKITNVVGSGLCLQASVDFETLGIDEDAADALEREQEREWKLFCRTADFSRVQIFDELQRLALRSSSESGDVVVIRRYRKDAGDVYGTKIQLLEADRLSNPNRQADTDVITGGVEIDKHGVPQGYHISNKHPGNLRAGLLTWERVAARTPEGLPTVLHLFDRQRPEQTRGVPYLAPVIEYLKQLGDYTDAEVRGAVVSAMYTLIIETPVDEDQNPIAGEKDSSLDDNEVKLGSGASLSLAPGEKASFADPTRPNTAFDPFVQALLRQIGVALEIPFELLIKHFTASYSASRAALEMAWQFFSYCRTWLGHHLCQAVYEWMMDEAVATGRLDRPGFFDDALVRQAYCGSRWIGPNRASLNPKQEAEADEIDIRNCVKTREEVCIERTGGEWEQKYRQLVKEQRMRQEGGLITPSPDANSSASASDDDDNNDAGDEEDETQPRRGQA